MKIVAFFSSILAFYSLIDFVSGRNVGSALKPGSAGMLLALSGRVLGWW